MNKRTTNTIRIIMSSDSDTSVRKLAAHFNVSDRTIRNDLYDINSFLFTNDLEQLTISANGTISYYGDRELVAKMILQKDLDFYTYKLNREERKQIAAAILLDGCKYITMSAIADEMLISRQTLINDLDDIKKYFNSYNLKVQSNSNKGLRIVGTEKNRRNMLLSIIDESMDSDEDLQGFSNPFSKLLLSLLFDNEQTEIFESIIKAVEEKHDTYFTDASYKRVLYYCMFAIKRIRAEHFCEADPAGRNAKYSMASEILLYLCDYFHIDCFEDEVTLLSEILAKQYFIKSGPGDDNDPLTTQIIASRFISSISDELNMNLTTDFIFYKNLANHMESTMNYTFDETIQSSTLDILMQDYAEVFEAARRHIKVFNDYLGREMSCKELTYMVLHICAAIERRKNLKSLARVILVCGDRSGRSLLLGERLKQQFRFDIVQILSPHKLSDRMMEETDLIISTVPLAGISKDYVIISDMLSDSDYLKIHRKLRTMDCENKPRRIIREFSTEELMEKYRTEVCKYLPIAAADSLMTDLRKATDHFFRQDNRAGHNLCEYLTEDLIQVDVHCKDYREAIRASGNILLQTGAIESDYIDAMIECAESNGPYFVLSKGFAMPHASTDRGVREIGMSLIRLAEPIVFIDEAVGLIEFVCCLSAVDADGHVNALLNLVNLLDNPNFKTELWASKTPRQIAEVIRRFEEDL